MVKEIPLQNGMVALVDDEDFQRVNKHQWTYCVSSDRIRVTIWNENKVILTRFILGIDEKDVVISFKDKNNFNCQKDNLIKMDRSSASIRNRGQRGKTSKYKGVSFCKQTSKYKAQIQFRGKQKNLGRYNTEEEAAKVYNAHAIELFGELAFLNVIGKSSEPEDVVIQKSRQFRSRNKCGYRGLKRNGNKYGAIIRVKGKNVSLGSFNTPEQAAKAYDKKAYELHGDKLS